LSVRTGGSNMISELPEATYDKNGTVRTNWSKGAYEWQEGSGTINSPKNFRLGG
jgi:hypothetical protein